VFIRPVSWWHAREFVRNHHSHHPPSLSHQWALGCFDDDWTCHGVIVVGRPVARAYDRPGTSEVTRCCTDRTKNVASMLYAAVRREARRRGIHSLLTYTLIGESGTSLVAAGWEFIKPAGGGSWTCPSRPRTDKAPTVSKNLWLAC
jgi:hypothetical protein